MFGVVAPAFLAGLAAVNVGIAQAAATAAVEHAAARTYPDGTALAELPTIQHQLADMDLTARSARLLVRDAGGARRRRRRGRARRAHGGQGLGTAKRRRA